MAIHVCCCKGKAQWPVHGETLMRAFFSLAMAPELLSLRAFTAISENPLPVCGNQGKPALFGW
jgi:hypothetical protein